MQCGGMQSLGIRVVGTASKSLFEQVDRDTSALLASMAAVVGIQLLSMNLLLATNGASVV